MKSTMVILAIVISYFLYWATNNVCKHNMLLDKKSNMMDEIKDADDYSLGKTKIYIYKELNCTKVDEEFTYQTIIDNLETISIIVYQELTTDIRGNPN